MLRVACSREKCQGARKLSRLNDVYEAIALSAFARNWMIHFRRAERQSSPGYHESNVGCTPDLLLGERNGHFSPNPKSDDGNDG